MLKSGKTVLIVIDVQGKLANLMHGKDAFLQNLQKTIRGLRALGIPILWAEQNPAGLGPTVPEVAELLSGIAPIGKMSFSCCQHEPFMRALKAAGRSQVLIAGIETHVCVYQTAMDLIEADYDVEVVADAVASRTPENKELGLQKMRDAGVGLTSMETALFELLRVAEGAQFKEILKIVK